MPHTRRVVLRPLALRGRGAPARRRRRRRRSGPACRRRATCSASSPATTTRSRTSASCASTCWRSTRRRTACRCDWRAGRPRATRCSSRSSRRRPTSRGSIGIRDISRRLALVRGLDDRRGAGAGGAKARPSSGSTTACTRARSRRRSTRCVLAHRVATDESPEMREIRDNVILVLLPCDQPGRHEPRRRLVPPHAAHAVPGQPDAVAVPEVRRATTTTATATC